MIAVGLQQTHLARLLAHLISLGSKLTTPLCLERFVGEQSRGSMPIGIAQVGASCQNMSLKMLSVDI
jgi:hypothetical protein